MNKKDFPVWNIRRLLEPGPIVLVSSAHKDQTNIMKKLGARNAADLIRIVMTAPRTHH